MTLPKHCDGECGSAAECTCRDPRFYDPALVSASSPEERQPGYDMSIHINPDARAWARFFMETYDRMQFAAPDEEMMVGWFANAMMAMHDFHVPALRTALAAAEGARDEAVKEHGLALDCAMENPHPAKGCGECQACLACALGMERSRAAGLEEALREASDALASAMCNASEGPDVYPLAGKTTRDLLADIARHTSAALKSARDALAAAHGGKGTR